LFFFFSSRRRHTRFSRDWSSDVCSSDLGGTGSGRATDADPGGKAMHRRRARAAVLAALFQWDLVGQDLTQALAAAAGAGALNEEIGRASCRERMQSAEAAGASTVRGKKR